MVQIVQKSRAVVDNSLGSTGKPLEAGFDSNGTSNESGAPFLVLVHLGLDQFDLLREKTLGASIGKHLGTELHQVVG